VNERDGCRRELEASQKKVTEQRIVEAQANQIEELKPQAEAHGGWMELMQTLRCAYPVLHEHVMHLMTRFLEADPFPRTVKLTATRFPFHGESVSEDLDKLIEFPHIGTVQR
jgi:hypothetical protein